jgi:hypothetical protein
MITSHNSKHKFATQDHISHSLKHKFAMHDHMSHDLKYKLNPSQHVFSKAICNLVTRLDFVSLLVSCHLKLIVFNLTLAVPLTLSRILFHCTDFVLMAVWCLDTFPFGHHLYVF